MARAIVLVCLLASSYAQLIYPDQYERMRTSTLVPNYDRQSRDDPNAYKSNPGTMSTVVFPQQPYVAAAVAAQSNQQTYSSVQSQPTQKPLQEWDDHVNNIITRGIEKFTLDVEREIYKANSRMVAGSHQNIIFSPLSLSIALAMVLLGSAGRTFDEVSKILGLETGIDVSRHSEVVHQMFGLLLTQVHDRLSSPNAPRIDVASAVFVQEGYPIRPEFKKITEDAYQSEVRNLNFAANAAQAQQIINNWVSQKTMGKILSILSDAPSPDTSAILLSALYFKGEWNQHFLPNGTKRKPFYIEPNEAVDVDMMYNGGTFPFYEDKQLGVKVVSLPYKGLETSMYVLLPTASGAAALRNFENQLTPEILEHLINNVRNETCIIGLPRMELSNSWSLVPVLKSLGVESLFDPYTADLSLLSGEPGRATSTGSTASKIVPPGTTAPRPASVVPPSVPTSAPRAIPTTFPASAAGKSRAPQTTNNDLFIFSRFGEGNGARRNFFMYDDKIRGFTVRQWATGFSIGRIRRTERDVGTNDEAKAAKDSGDTKDKNAYVVDDSAENHERTKVVSLEQNKYRFQKAVPRENVRTKRQDRPIDEDFLNYIKARNFTSYGLDDLRNSANLINPGLFATQVLHKVKIDITEKGTEAAAVTSVIIERDGNQKRLIANRPFIFFIRHNPTKLLLFWGTLNQPTPNYFVT